MSLLPLFPSPSPPSFLPYYLLDHFQHVEDPSPPPPHAPFLPFTPAIFDARSLDDTIPEGFNSVLINLNGRTTSDLNWEKERLTALRYIDQGLRLFWNIDLGLFSNLDLPLTDQTQFLALTLSLHHFKDSLWKEFQEHTVGLCLYRGPIDFNQTYPWDEEQNHNFQGWLEEHFQTISRLGVVVNSCSHFSSFDQIHYSMFEGNVEGSRLLSLFCCDVAAEYFNLLAQSLPDLIHLFHLFDTKAVQDPLLLAHLLSKERFARFLRMATEGVLPINSLKSTSSNEGFLAALKQPDAKFEEIKVGVSFPSFPYSHTINATLLKLLKDKIFFRVIPEGLLMMEWDELDCLIVDPAYMSPHGMRQLRGFHAAGGLIISCDSTANAPSTLPSLPFSKWIETYYHD
jgi:hypothetical protein